MRNVRPFSTNFVWLIVTMTWHMTLAAPMRQWRGKDNIFSSLGSGYSEFRIAASSHECKSETATTSAADNKVSRSIKYSICWTQWARHSCAIHRLLGLFSNYSVVWSCTHTTTVERMPRSQGWGSTAHAFGFIVWRIWVADGLWVFYVRPLS